MKHIPHKTDFTFIYLGVKYRAKTVDVAWSYADIKIYKYTKPKWYSIIYDPFGITIPKSISRKAYYNAESLLEFIKHELNKYLEKELKKKINKHKKIDIQLSFDEIDNN